MGGISRRSFIKSAASVLGASVAFPKLLWGETDSGKSGNASVEIVAEKKTQYKYVDAHCHLVDFLQRTDGITALVEAMDESGVGDIQIMGMPLIKKWDRADAREPLYYLDDDARTYWYSATDVLVAREIEKLPQTQQCRFHPFICGFNPTNRNAREHILRMLEWFPDFWEGVGEVMTRHDDLTHMTYGETARADHIALDPIYEIAAEHDMPVQIHSNIGSKQLREPIYLHEMENAVKKHPETKFIWAHAGVSRNLNIPSITSDIRRLFKSYDNLWIDLSWVIYDQELVVDGKPNPGWVDLLNEFPTRLMIGTDKVGHFSDYKQTIQRYDVILDALEPEASRMIARDTFFTVIPKRGRSKFPD